MTSAMIHADMFKDLRDRAVVLCDLSLGNPNVLYELGIRHTLSSAGTVLMCCEDSPLPFDVHLSRVVFYRYDGQSLDWEEAERVVEKLHVVLQQARRAEPDSPVHALLESVVRNPGPDAEGDSRRVAKNVLVAVRPYEKLVAEGWRTRGADVDALFNEHSGSVFGARALGELCIASAGDGSLPAKAWDIARRLSDLEQYDLANSLFDRLHRERRLDDGGLLKYANSYAEEHLDVPGAERAIALAEEAGRLVRNRDGELSATSSQEALSGHAWVLRALAGLQHWRWQLTGRGDQLEEAIASWSVAIQAMERARSAGKFPPGVIAQGRLKAMLLLRYRDGVDRADIEGHGNAVLALKRRDGDDEVGVSYLQWFQAISLADQGAADAALRLALDRRARDAPLAVAHPDVGRRQYAQLRRFIEQNSSMLHCESILGRISQVLQTRPEDLV
jgi:hypothetical protein